MISELSMDQLSNLRNIVSNNYQTVVNEIEECVGLVALNS